MDTIETVQARMRHAYVALFSPTTLGHAVRSGNVRPAARDGRPSSAVVPATRSVSTDPLARAG